MKRDILITRMQLDLPIGWDVIVIGGGATGLGVALDAVCRGYRTILLEQADFAKGTSSKSTKLMHGGVRYMAQGDIVLVMEALHERSRMHQNAAHITRNQEFVIPVYTIWDALKYTIGLKFYDLLAGRLSMGKSHFIGVKKTLKRLPMLHAEGLKGGVVYHDGQFDDARYALDLAKKIVEKGGLPLNYFKVVNLLKDDKGKVIGVKAIDQVTGFRYSVKAKTVINASGVFADSILEMDQPGAEKTIRPSQGVHIVLDASFLQGDSALMIPKTSDGRVLFAIPWYGKVVVGTTDTPIDHIDLEPKALQMEIDFILETAGRFLTKAPRQEDILSVFAGLRPLAANKGKNNSTKEISRRHKITVSASGLISVLGGKWTIYREMAEDTINRAIQVAGLQKRICNTRDLQIGESNSNEGNKRFTIYGNHADEIEKLIDEKPELAEKLHPDLPYTVAEIHWICRNEMPVHLEDILSRRTRSLLLNAKASAEISEKVALIMAQELNYSNDWIESELDAYWKLLDNYLPEGHSPEIIHRKKTSKIINA